MLDILFWFGAICGGVIVFLVYYFKKPNTLPEVKLKTEKDLLSKNLNQLESEYKEIQNKEKQLIEENSKLRTQYESKEKELKYKEDHIKDFSQKLKLEIEQNAQKLFKDTTKTYQENSEKSIKNLITPLRENIQNFQKNFEGNQISLSATIKSFQEINSQMQKETHNLTQALQGSVKTQGEWGEILLENILEKSGLSKGEEFFIQSDGLQLKNEDGQPVRPDVVVKLPENKHIVIDSKTSLSDFISYQKEKDPDKKEEYKGKIINSLKTHIKNLSTKNYSQIDSLKTPDFVLMFIPAEPVFSLAVQSKNQLFEMAWDKSIVIVSPITLYATLKTIASIWKIEKQNKNSETIAKESGLLLDKFTGFLDDMLKIDKSLGTARESYDSAYKKLKEGRGNLISKTERLKKLGAKSNKELPKEFIQN